MYTHAPQDYLCPFCRIVRETAAGQNPDVVFQDEQVTAFMSLHDIATTPGHVLIVPNTHHENLFDLPDHLAAHIIACTRAVAMAMKRAYQCDGISLRQHNEPAGGQDVWHYHMHIFPRYSGDLFARGEKIILPAEERSGCASLLRKEMVFPPLMEQ